MARNLNRKQETLPECNEATWTHRQDKREKAVEFVKRTAEYKTSAATSGIVTPDPTDRSISKRHWESQVKLWRAALHTHTTSTSTKQKVSSSMVRVEICSLGGCRITREYCREIPSRAIQRQLCADFGKSFPALKAELAFEGSAFDEFDSLPFKNCPEDATFQVIFRETDDPYFYDLMQRKGKHMTLAEELAADELEADNVVTIGYKAVGASGQLL